MGIFQRAADLAQKTAVLGLMSLFGFQVYQIGYNVYERKIQSQYQKTEYFKKIAEVVQEEEKAKEGIDKRPDLYVEEDDQSYIKKQPKLVK